MKKRAHIISILTLLSVLFSLTILFRTIDYKDVIYGYNYLNRNSKMDYQSIKLLESNSRIILQMSNQFNVNPIAISGIIATENTLNINHHKELEDYLIKVLVSNKSDIELQDLLRNNDVKIRNQVDKPKNLYYKLYNKMTWSIGICQISIIRAIKLETILCVKECRTQRSISEIITSLLDPAENIKYCSLELSLIQDYYNNTFGRFIMHNESLLNKILMKHIEDETEQRITKAIKI